MVNGSCPEHHIIERSITQWRQTLSSTAAWKGEEQATIQIHFINNRRRRV